MVRRGFLLTLVLAALAVVAVALFSQAKSPSKTAAKGSSVGENWPASPGASAKLRSAVRFQG